MKIYANSKNSIINLSLKSGEWDDNPKRNPDFFMVEEVIGCEFTTPIITETWDDALNAVYELMKMSLLKYGKCETRDEFLNEMGKDGVLTMIAENYTYYFTAYGVTANHDDINWKITPVYAEIK